MKFPCEDCLVLASCIAKTRQCMGSLKTYTKLSTECNIIGDYIFELARERGWLFPNFVIQVDAIREFNKLIPEN